MTDQNTMLCVAMLMLMIIEVAAIMQKIDGVLMASIIGAICAVAGVKLQQIRATKK